MRRVFEIGALRLDADACVLTHAGATVALGARGVAVLAALVSRAGEHVPKADIMDAAWPGLVVEEANLAVQISAIRRVLACVPGGEGWIETLARRGYRFVGPVAAIPGRASAAPMPTDRTRTNLPQVLTSFVGREREIAQVKQLLPTTRLLTITGTGGIGKTRLVLQAAAEVLDAYRDGVWFVDLAPLLDPALVPSALAQVLGVKESAQQPLSKSLCDFLRGKELLLILDNCEHVLGATADLVDALLRDTTRASIVATSRESLRVAAEQSYPLGVLPLPDPKSNATAIARSDAVQLFVDRARQHRPKFDLDGARAQAVAAICVRLDGLPLALELAAARVAVLPVEEIMRLIDQRFRLLTRGSGSAVARQQTLRAMIDWSYDLLDDAEKQLFARLSVFAGGWTVAAAEAVGAGEPLAKDDVVYLLIALIEKSLVVADEDGDRYRMLETVRAYAQERLAQSGSAALVQERHRDYFLALAEEAEPKLTGAEQIEWLKRLETEHENLRAGMDWSLLAASPTGGLRLCGALQRFWITRGYLSEARERCARILIKDDGSERTSERAKVLGAAGVLAYSQADYPAAQSYHEQSLAIARDLGDRRRIADALSNLGNVALDRGDFVSSRALHEESLAIRRELGVPRNISSSLHNLGVVAHEQGEYSGAQALYEESLAIVEGLGDRAGIASTLGALGNVALDQGDYPAARARHEASLAILRELEDRRGIARSLHNLGIVAHDQGDHATALAMSREGLQIRYTLGDRRGIASSLEWLALVVAALDKSLFAIRILGAADRLRAEIGAPIPLNAQSVHDELRAKVRATLGDDGAFDRAWQEGRAMSLEQAIEFALHLPSPEPV